MKSKINPTGLHLAAHCAPHMHAAKPRLSQHRRQRIILWLLTVLAWVASVFGAGDASRLHRRGALFSLDRLAVMIKRLVAIRAAELTKRRVRKERAYFPLQTSRPAGLWRALYGASLRRALRHPDFATRIARLRSVIEQLDLWAAHMARRFKNGATKLHSHKFAHFVEALEQGVLCAPMPADSS
jgi:hypothetical protein